ncbi:glycosyltransferase family 4 protein [Pararcticibacter amylolyticus]|uniref:Glycosyl transferase family 1 domain-containing protein n=1 Tax=Pararcticibacter amylolyticus TaxID=2173175 RepID=A0A2U2PBN4_9SPHI|nr:glycosyltransferase family 4 protein [Pararcticibacter amylolyticus]PWG78807.1 hypothetical protein DDR33_20495 [Pararcticibacter amylolyticus]
MRILWLTQTPANASELLNYNNPGCGWISSLQNYLMDEKSITLGLCFFLRHDQFKIEYKNVTYYPLKQKYTSLTGKIYQKFSSALYDVNTEGLQKVLDDFKPDIIHLFGTETGMGEILELTKIPVVIHLQGLINPCTYAWLPKGVSKWQVLFNSPIKSIIFRTGYYFEHKFFKKRGIREKKIISNCQLFFGRTHWDKNYIRLYKDQFRYIKCEEMLRPSFYNRHWNNHPDTELKIVTTINPYLFKGLEIILETAKILKEKLNFNFKWTILGINQDHELVRLVEKLVKTRFSHNGIILAGAKDEESLIQELLSSNIYIHPSHIENSPNSICEAMLLGMPIIAGNVGGISTIIQHEKTGILYNSHDPYELAGRILEFYDSPSELIAYGKNARMLAQTRHNPKEIVRTVVNTYREILGESNSRQSKASECSLTTA